MKKTKLAVLLCTAVVTLAGFGTKEAEAAEQDTAWNYEKEITEIFGAFTYHAYLSENETEVWIHKIEIDKGKKQKRLDIPEELSGKTVTRLGYTTDTFDPYDYVQDISMYDSVEEYEEDLYNAETLANLKKNLFGEFVVPIDEDDGSSGGKLNGIKEVIIPSSVEVIQPGTFAGLDKITTITIPGKVTAIEEITFYGCDSLKTVKLPAGIEKIDISAFERCKKLSTIKLSSKNTAYGVKNKCLIEKKSQTLLYALSGTNTLKIPEGVKILKMYSLGNTDASKVTIPASVRKIEGEAFHVSYGLHDSNKKIKNVTVSKKNKIYAKDGQCIYNKKEKSLSVAIPDGKRELVISEKIERLTPDYSFVNCKIRTSGIKKAVFPKTLKYVEAGSFVPCLGVEKMYFTAKKPPKTILSDNVDHPLYGVRGSWDRIYVPKASAKAYKKWLKKYDEYDADYGFYTF